MELIVNVSGAGGLSFDYMSELFDAGTITRMASNYAALLEAAAAQPEEAVERLSIVGAADRSLLTRFCTGELRPEYLDSPLIHGAFASVAAREPGRPCLVTEDRTMTYGEVRAHRPARVHCTPRCWCKLCDDAAAQVSTAANRVASALLRQGLVPGSVVGVMLERSLERVIALLGVFKAGGELEAG